MPLLTEEEFKTLVPTAIKNDFLLDRSVYDVIHKFNTFKTLKKGLLTACKIGSLELFQVHFVKNQFLYYTPYWIQTLFLKACDGGNVEIIHQLMKDRIQDIISDKRQYWQGFNRACFYGHLSIVQLLHHRVPHSPWLVPPQNWGFLNACYNNQKEVVLFLLAQYQLPNINEGLIYAAAGHRTMIISTIVDWCVRKKKNYNLNWALFGACWKGNLELARMMLEQGCDDLNLGLTGAKLGLQEWEQRVYNYLRSSSRLGLVHRQHLLNCERLMYQHGATGANMTMKGCNDFFTVIYSKDNYGMTVYDLDWIMPFKQ